MKKAVYIVLEPSGSLEQVEMTVHASPDRYIGLEELQLSVGGLIELVTTTGNVSLFCNEEGKLLGLPVNDVATDLWHHYLSGHLEEVDGDWDTSKILLNYDRLVGSVVIAGAVNKNGDQLGLTEKALREVAGILLSSDCREDFFNTVLPMILENDNN